MLNVVPFHRPVYALETDLDDDQLSEIMRSLGRLEEGMERQREDFNDEKESTRQHRDRLGTRLDKLDETVSIVGKVAAQARDQATEVKKVVDSDVKPVTDEVRRMKWIGGGILAFVTVAATGLGISIATVGEQVLNWFRALLKVH